MPQFGKPDQLCSYFRRHSGKLELPTSNNFFPPQMKFISWNCQGVENSNFRRSCTDLIRQHRPDAICFLETKATSDLPSISFLTRLGFDQNFQIPAAGFAGGLWLFWKSTSISLDIIASTNQTIHCSFLQGSNRINASFVYARPNPRLKALLWTDLQSLASTISSPWFVIGDWNEIGAVDHVFPASSASITRGIRFRNALDSCNLMLTEPLGCKFTWIRSVNNRIALRE